MIPSGINDYIDPEALEELRSLFSALELERFLSAFLYELKTKPQFIASLVARKAYQDARAEAHRFSGIVRYFGCKSLIAALDRLENCDDHLLEPVAATIERIAQDFTVALESNFQLRNLTT